MTGHTPQLGGTTQPTASIQRRYSIDTGGHRAALPTATPHLALVRARPGRLDRHIQLRRKWPAHLGGHRVSRQPITQQVHR